MEKENVDDDITISSSSSSLSNSKCPRNDNDGFCDKSDAVDNNFDRCSCCCCCRLFCTNDMGIIFCNCNWPSSLVSPIVDFFSLFLGILNPLGNFPKPFCSSGGSPWDKIPDRIPLFDDDAGKNVDAKPDLNFCCCCWFEFNCCCCCRIWFDNGDDDDTDDDDNNDDGSSTFFVDNLIGSDVVDDDDEDGMDFGGGGSFGDWWWWWWWWRRYSVDCFETNIYNDDFFWKIVVKFIQFFLMFCKIFQNKNDRYVTGVMCVKYAEKRQLRRRWWALSKTCFLSFFPNYQFRRKKN